MLRAVSTHQAVTSRNTRSDYIQEAPQRWITPNPAGSPRTRNASASCISDRPCVPKQLLIWHAYTEPWPSPGTDVAIIVAQYRAW